MESHSVQAKEVLTLHGISLSRPRIAIFQYLQEHHTHPTADEIYHDLLETIPTLSPATVYNTLRLFAEKQLCLSLTINEKRICFDGQTHPHGHFLCLNCGAIHDITIDILPIKVGDTLKDGHKIHEVHYYYKGVCAHCISSKVTNNNL